jgi:hypothetical protein
VGTIGNEAENLPWRALDSHLLAASAYSESRHILYLRFQSGEVYRYFTFPPEQYEAFLNADSQGRYFLGHIRNCFPYQRLPRT